MWTETYFWISRQELPWSPQATAIPMWCRDPATSLGIDSHFGDGYLYPEHGELAEKLAAIAPAKGAKKVYFGKSGAEAIQAAIKLARYHTSGEKFIAFYGCFHGRTMGALSLTASKAVQRKGFGSLLSGVFHAPYPDHTAGKRAATFRGLPCLH